MFTPMLNSFAANSNVSDVTVSYLNPPVSVIIPAILHVPISLSISTPKLLIIVINTCGFIDSAKQEGIDTILEMANYKEENCKYLIVTGCLVERYIEELEKELPEVDLFIPINNYDELTYTVVLVNDSSIPVKIINLILTFIYFK